MNVFHFPLAQNNKHSSFKYFFTAEKETEKTNIIHKSRFFLLLCFILLKELYHEKIWKNIQANISTK